MNESATSREMEAEHWIADLRAGQGDADRAILDRYWHRLLSLIRRHISRKLQSRIDAEDVLQSALGSFFPRAKAGQYTIEQSSDLWQLLAAISLNKLRKQAQWHTASKRDVSRELAATNLDHSTAASPDDAIVMREELAGVLRSLPSEGNLAIERFFEGASIEQIAGETGKSPRSIRRWIQTFRDQLLHRRVAESISPSQIVAPLAWEDYVLKQHLGSGGFGKVYRAIEKKRQRTVAIKSLHKRRQREPEAVRKFVREAQLLAKVSHPAIVGVHGLGQYPGGGYFLVLDWIDGENLQERIERKPLSLTETLRTVRQVAEAVGAMHRKNIVHGDLKPANILVSRTDGIYVTDFGLAALRSHRVTHECAQGGTLAYLAPEQLTGAPVDFPIDVHGLGGLLHALLTGSPPRSGSPQSILGDLHHGVPPVPLKELLPGLPEGIYDLVAKCLAIDPEQRPPTVQRFLRELNDLERRRI